MKNERKFRIVFETESGITDNIRVNTEGELSQALIAMLKRDWSRLMAGDILKIVEEE